MEERKEEDEKVRKSKVDDKQRQGFKHQQIVK